MDRTAPVDSPPSRRGRRCTAALTGFLLAVGLMVAPAPPAAATGGAINTYTDPTGLSLPRFITYGPDGNVWYTSANSRIGRITPLGDITTFPGASGPGGITSGPDGNLWFTNVGSSDVSRITPAGVITNFHHPDVYQPQVITAGPDGNLWFTTIGNLIGRITTAGVITVFSDPAGRITQPFGITAGADGNIWFTSFGQDRIGRITPAGVITTFTDPAGIVESPYAITRGPDGNVWFTTGNRIGRITPAGVITTFADPADQIASSYGITNGPDGNLWFTSLYNDRIGRITPAGVVTTYADPLGLVDGPSQITSGPNRRLWFATVGNNRIGRIEPPSNCNTTPPAHGFTDVPAGAWYGTALRWAKCHQIAAGFANGTYRPDDGVNRAQVVNMLWTLADTPRGAPAHGFADVPANAWYGPALNWAKAEGLVSGFAGNLYRPADPVNRAQIVSMIWNMVGQPAGSPHGFSDVPAGAWYGFALDWGKVRGVVSGFPGNVYRPADPVSRAQIVDMLYNLSSTGTAWSNWLGAELFSWRF